MKKFRLVYDTSDISVGSAIFRVVVYGVFFAVILCGGCSDNAIGTVVGESKVLSVPPVPSNVSATATSSSGITVSWPSVSPATGYNVYRSTSTNGSYGKVGGATSASYTDTVLSSGTVYYYKISAYNSGGESSRSPEVSAITIPGAPSIENADPESSGNITLSWSPVFGATGYIVYRDTIADGTGSQVGTISSTSYTDIGSSSGKTYYYKVAAYNASGISAKSSYRKVINIITDVPVVSAEATSPTDITVIWSPVSGATGYYVYRDTRSDGTYSKVETTSFTSYTDTELSSCVTYYYRVSAYNGTGEGIQSSYDSAVTKPNPPSGISATAESSSSIIVSWFSVSQDAGYNVYRSTSSDGSYSKVYTTTSTTYTNTGLSSCTTYYYKVSAYFSSCGESAVSSPISAQPLPISQTVSVTAMSSNTIAVSWSPICGARGYYVERSTGDSDVYTRMLATSTTSYKNTGLSPGTTYCYRVYVDNGNAGEILPSSDHCATTLPTLIDFRDDGKIYNTVKIGNKVWMAENLNYRAASGSWCYGDDESTCAAFGRLYNWAAAMDIDTDDNGGTWDGDEDHQGICPEGWRLPSRQEWVDLAKAVGGTGTYGNGGVAGSELKSNNGWNGTNNYEFSALPGGYRNYSGGEFSNTGTIGYWWTASEANSDSAYYRSMKYNSMGVSEDAGDKRNGMSVRCIQE